MWKNNKISVDKMFVKSINKNFTLNTTQTTSSYPHLISLIKTKISYIKTIYPTIHIFTPLIVLVIFYI